MDSPLEKPGYQTTEFWATVTGSVIVGVASQYNVPLDQGTIVSISTMVIGYVASRTATKITKHISQQGSVNGTSSPST